MRHLSGTLDGVQHVIREYDTGMVECPAALIEALEQPDGGLPRGEALENACRVLFGNSLVVREE